MNVMVKGKSLFGFKYIRFKSTSQATELKVKDVLQMRTSKLAELLDCTSYTAREILTRNGYLLSSNSSEFVQNATFCGQFLKLSDVVEFPCLLNMIPSLLQHRFFSLKELGCSHISGSSILRYPQLVKKTARELEREGLHFCLESQRAACEGLLPPGEERDDLVERLGRMREEALWRVKEAANAQVLASHLDCSLAVTHHMFRVYPPLRLQSTARTVQAVRELRHRFRFPKAKLCGCPSVLSVGVEGLRGLLRGVPSVGGVATEELACRLPPLLRSTPERLAQVDEVLREGGVKAAQVLCCPKATLLCPRTLRHRLQVLEGRPELRPLRAHRRFLWLAYYFGRLEERLRALQLAAAPCSISAFTVSEDKFVRSLTLGDRERRCSTEALAYLAEVVGAEGAAEVAERLPPAARPRLPDCSRVVEYLRAAGVSRLQLAHGLDATLYDVRVVRAHLEALRARPQWPEWAAHYNLLQLLVYAIEAESGFRGGRSVRPTLSDYAF